MAIRAISIVMFALTLSTAKPAVQSRPPDATNHLTLIGCVKRSELGGGGAGAARTEPARYVLVNITLPADANRDAGSELVAENVKMYSLDDSGGQMIAPHVGERVEVTGALVASAKRPEASSNEPPSPPMLKVESLRTIVGGSSCNP
jgi:hypothetical protein